MKILYGVQGTGNGHISRACAMAKAFQDYPEIEVTWLMSGRDKALGCGNIENFLWREGLTFVVDAGKINIIKTLKKLNYKQFKTDIKNLNLSSYDLIVSDYEPVISHAAKKQGIPVIGIGHQYAFNYKIPQRGENFVSKLIMRNFAPVTQGVGLHWHHFDAPILPPILDIEIPETLPQIQDNKIIVYLPFESTQAILEVFSGIPEFEFYIYHPEFTDLDNNNIHTRKISREFKNDLLDARNVITNAGFELISECLQLGKSILVKPLHGQMEQLSNAHALEILGYAQAINSLDTTKIQSWLRAQNKLVKVIYPDVAAALTAWIANGTKTSIEELSEALWPEPKSGVQNDFSALPDSL